MGQLLVKGHVNEGDVKGHF